MQPMVDSKYSKKNPRNFPDPGPGRLSPSPALALEKLSRHLSPFLAWWGLAEAQD